MLRIALLAAALLMAGSVWAQSPLKTGDNAPDLNVSYWLDVPEFTSFSEVRGDVILLKAWGSN
ncbi:MAG: hypothetical protein BroJett014_22280 [Planctomycetota bacterium]|nr:hypothetical protein [Planctomycetota bacterium]GIK53255.1 MAG: hypothetical protein BroJett014_22280 [Planctomycetota bacterium]